MTWIADIAILRGWKFLKTSLSSHSAGNPVWKFKTKPVTEFRLLIGHRQRLIALFRTNTNLSSNKYKYFSKQIHIKRNKYKNKAGDRIPFVDRAPAASHCTFPNKYKFIFKQIQILLQANTYKKQSRWQNSVCWSGAGNVLLHFSKQIQIYLQTNTNTCPSKYKKQSHWQNSIC